MAYSQDWYPLESMNAPQEADPGSLKVWPKAASLCISMDTCSVPPSKEISSGLSLALPHQANPLSGLPVLPFPFSQCILACTPPPLPNAKFARGWDNMLECVAVLHSSTFPCHFPSLAGEGGLCWNTAIIAVHSPTTC